MKTDWSIPDENDMIQVPDELAPFFNRVATQIRFHTISGKNEVITVAHIVQIAQEFFDQCRCPDKIKHGETSVMCCNECGRPTEEFWTKKIQL